jgi:hypothetical protein
MNDAAPAPAAETVQRVELKVTDAFGDFAVDHMIRDPDVVQAVLDDPAVRGFVLMLEHGIAADGTKFTRASRPDAPQPQEAPVDDQDPANAGTTTTTTTTTDAPTDPAPTDPPAGGSTETDPVEQTGADPAPPAGGVNADPASPADGTDAPTDPAPTNGEASAN